MGSVSRSQTATGRTGAAGDLEALSGLSEALDGPVRAVRPGAAVLWHSSCREAARQVVAAWPSVSEREAAIAACSSVWTWSAAASRERFLAVFDRPFDHVVTADAVSAHRAVREAAEVTVVQPSTVGPEASVDGVDGAVEPGAGTESTSSVGGVAKDPFTGSGNPADQGAGDALAEPSLGHLDGASHGASDGAVSGTSLGASEASIREVALRLLGSVALTDSDTADLTDPNSVGLTTDSVSPHGAGSRTPENGIVDGEKPALTCGNENSRPTHDKLSESSRPAHDTLTPASPPEREREGEVEMEGVNAERSRNAREAASERTAQTPGASPRTSACGAPKSTIDSTEEKTPHAARPEPSLSTPANPHSSTPSTAPQTDPHETTTATPAVPDATPVAGSTPAPAPTSPPVSGEAAGTSQPVSPRSDAPIETPEAATEPPRHEQAPNGHSPSSPSGDQPQEGADMTPSPHGTLTEPSVSETVDPNSQAAQDGLFDMAPVEPPQPKPKRNPPATWTAERKEQAHAILRPWFEKYGSTTAQSYGVIFGVLISAMKNGMSPEDLTRAMEILAADRMTISGGTINIALAKGSKTQREDERVAAQQALTSPETYTRTTW